MLAGLLFELLDDLFFDLSHNQLWHNASILSSAINAFLHRQFRHRHRVRDQFHRAAQSFRDGRHSPSASVHNTAAGGTESPEL